MASVVGDNRVSGGLNTSHSQPCGEASADAEVFAGLDAERAAVGGVRKPRLLDLFCCAGGAAVGYHRAGFEVVGIDIKPRHNYPFEFRQADALTLDPDEIAAEFDAVHASPECQSFSPTKRIHQMGRTSGYKSPRLRDAADDHPDLIAPTRAILRASGLPFIIENVVGARGQLIDPIMLCGSMFGLKVYRHRLFELSFPHVWNPPAHVTHVRGATKATDGYSSLARGATIISCAGNNFRRIEGMAAMGIDWHATRPEVAQMIPPAYTEFLGRQLMAEVIIARAVADTSEGKEIPGTPG
jgi:DNA (cytosine-5)-methyltransferase 1